MVPNPVGVGLKILKGLLEFPAPEEYLNLGVHAFIIDSASTENRTAYLAAINGIGVEDTFYNGDLENDNDLAPQNDVITILQDYQTAEKFVLAIDYLTDLAKIDNFYSLAEENGYVPYVNTRDLSQFTFPVGHEP